MPPSQTIALSETALDDLNPAGRVSQPSLYDAQSDVPVISTARAEPLKQIGPGTRVRPHLKHIVTAIANYKLARWSFRAVLFFGATGICYEIISLVPTYLGLRIQRKTETDSSQGTTRSFVQECLSRKVSLQSIA